jgi:hypothetical protein
VKAVFDGSEAVTSAFDRAAIPPARVLEQLARPTMKTPRQPAPPFAATLPPDLPAAPGNASRDTVSAEQRHALVEQVAYRLAEGRGFSPGEELGDWLAAEAEVDRQLSQTEGGVK